MRKYGSLLLVLLLIVSPMFLGAQEQQPPEQPTEQPPAEQPPAEEPAADQPPAEQPPAEEPMEQPAEQPPAGQEAQLQPPLVGATSLIDQSIMDSSGAQAGTVRDAWLSTEGNVTFVVADLQNVPGMEPGEYVVPPDALSMEQDQITLNLTEGQQLMSVDEARSSGEIAPDAVRVSDLMAFSLVDEQGQNIGRIENVVLDLSTAEVAYVAISFGGILGAADKLFAVPYSDVWYNLSRDTVTLFSINQQALEQNEGFTPDSWPQEADPNWNSLQQPAGQPGEAEPQPPVEEQPPAEQPPAEEPQAEQPPADQQPPAEEPPAEEPQAEQPPAEEPQTQSP